MKPIRKCRLEDKRLIRIIRNIPDPDEEMTEYGSCVWRILREWDEIFLKEQKREHDELLKKLKCYYLDLDLYNNA